MPRCLSFVVAMPSEARPLIESMQLRPLDAPSSTRLYGRDNVRLIVSGVGKVASASAVGFIAGREPPDTQHVWINAGIAGHAELPVGTIGIAHEIVDTVHGSAFYPAITFKAPCESYALTCHDEPTTTYAGNALCDMESAGFFSAAARFSSVEFIHAVKVVSDNAQTDVKSLDRVSITNLMAGALDTVGRLAETLEQLAKIHLPQVPVLPIEGIIKLHKFSVSQKFQLREIARRWAVVRGDEAWPPLQIEECKNSRDIISKLLQILETTPVLVEKQV